jgi:serine/alanine adding enzyme
LEDERGNLLAVIPLFTLRGLVSGRKLSCLPSSEYCFPLAVAGADIAQLVNTVKSEMHNSNISYLEIKGWKNSTLPGELGLKEYSYYLNHVTTLGDDPELLRARFNGKEGYHLRRNLKQAEESGISVREAQNVHDLRDFYKLTIITRRRLNLLPEPYRFFHTIYRHIIIPGHGVLLLAKAGDRVIAGSIYFRFKDTFMLKFNASDIRYSQYRPNYLLTWKAMEQACQEGYRYFDFGRSHPENEGLVRFKRQWGSKETLLSYYYYPDVNRVSSLSRNGLIYRTYTAFNKIIPGFVANLAGQFLYKRVG